MPFRDYVSEIAGGIPRLGYLNAIKLVQRAWKNILDLRTWSFLSGFADLYAPTVITTGTVTVTQFSTAIQADAAAQAALNLAGFFPPLTSTSIGQGRQFRVGSPSTSSLLTTSSTGPLYNIVGYDPITGILTIDRPYFGPTVIGSLYSVYRAYYSPPVTDFLKYEAVINTTSGYAIIRDALNVPQQSLDLFDPQRGSVGDAYSLSPFQDDSTGLVVHEFYPAPQSATVYNAYYKRRGQTLSDSVDVPAQFPSDLLVSKAFVLAVEWAQENIALYPELANTNWVNAQQIRDREFKEQLIQAIKQDDEIMPKMPIKVGRYYSSFPLGGQWLQSHALLPFFVGR